jgi:hypothetical protein
MAMRWIALAIVAALAGVARADARREDWTPIVTAEDPDVAAGTAWGSTASNGVAYVVISERTNACWVWSSSDGGLTWAHFATTLGICSGGDVAAVGGVVIVAVRGLRRSSGEAWTQVAGPWRDDDPPNDVIAIGDVFYAVAADRVYASKDGVTWTAFGPRLPHGGGMAASLLAWDDRPLVAITSGEDVRTYRLAGAAWTKVVEAGVVCAVGAIVVAAPRDGGLFSNDAGATWKPIDLAPGSGISGCYGDGDGVIFSDGNARRVDHAGKEHLIDPLPVIVTSIVVIGDRVVGVAFDRNTTFFVAMPYTPSPAVRSAFARLGP